MAQNYTIDCFAASNVGLTDLQNMENNFECLRTLFSGSSAPTNSTGGVPWFDTGKKLLKIRNSTNGAWLGILSATTAPRFWIYANAAEDGWIVDSSVTDRITAIKGGSNAYNVSGGGVAGSWTTSHNHQWYWTASGSGNDGSYNSGGSTLALSGVSANIGFNGFNEAAVTPGANYYTNISTMARPAAAVGTLQYLNI